MISDTRRVSEFLQMVLMNSKSCDLLDVHQQGKKGSYIKAVMMVMEKKGAKEGGDRLKRDF